MEDEVEWKQLAHNYCKRDSNSVRTENVSEVRIICNAIQRRETTFLEVIEELEPVLCSSEVSLRRCGTKLILELLCSLPKDFLIEKEVECVGNFLIFRLQDHHTIIPNALQGLQTLTQYINIPKGFAANVITAIFKEIHVPSQLQADRYAVYQIIFHFLHTRLEELKCLESMVLGFIQVIDGEREPHCLMLAFNIVPEIVRHFDLGPFAEDLFEVLASYFPVDFNPRGGDLISITRDDLAAALHKCLIVTPKFAQFCIKLLIEKWEDGNVTSRLDLYHVLESSCIVFKKEEYEEYSFALWNLIRKEIYMEQNKDVKAAALSSLTALVKIMSEGNKNEMKKDFLGEILSECRQHICQPELVIDPYISKILEAVSSPSFVTATQTASFIIPLLLKQYPIQTQIAQRKAILEILVKLLSSLAQHKAEEGHKPLGENNNLVLELLFSVLDSRVRELCCLALNAFSEAVNIDNLLDDFHRELLARHLVNLLLSSEGKKYLKSSSLHLLSQISQNYPSVTEMYIMPTLKKNLSEYKSGDSQELKNILDAMIAASGHFTILMDVLVTLISFMSDQMLVQNAVIDAKVTARSLLSLAIQQISSLSTHFLCSSVIQPLVVLCFKVTPVEQLLHGDRYKFLELVGEILQKTVEILDSGSVLPYLSSLIELSLYGAVPCLLNFENDFFQQKGNGSLSYEAISLLLLKSFLAGVSPSCNFPHISNLIEHLVKAGSESKNYLILEFASHCTAIIINKKGRETEFTSLISKLYDELLNHSSVSNDDSEDWSQHNLFLWIWITKALVLSGHPQMSAYIKQLIVWLESDTLGKKAAEGFATIVEDSPGVFSVKGHACTKLFHRQRFFIETSPHLYKGYSKTSKEYKANYLIALCSQLKYLPKTVIIPELSSILPMLLHALFNSQDVLLLGVLMCLEDLLKENPLYLENDLNAVVTQLLHIAGGQNPMKIKILALSCLASLCPIPDHLLLPLKQTVIRDLGACLDDKKRLVRKAAVQARCQWHLSKWFVKSPKWKHLQTFYGLLPLLYGILLVGQETDDQEYQWEIHFILHCTYVFVNSA